MNNSRKPRFVPVTPSGTPVMHLESTTEEQAWKRLLKDAAHMPYRGIEGFKARGYTVQNIGGQP